MSMILTCRTCGDTIGTQEPGIVPPEYFSVMDLSRDVVCLGYGKHPAPKRSVTTKRLGLIREITLTYPETETHSSWAEYGGPPILLFLWFAILCNGRERSGVVVNGEWAWWSLDIGFFGGGVKELKKMRAQKSSVS